MEFLVVLKQRHTVGGHGRLLKAREKDLGAAGRTSLKRGLPTLAELDVSADELVMGTCRPVWEKESLDLLRLGTVLHLVLQRSVQRNWLLPALTAQVTTTTPAPSILELPGFLENFAVANPPWAPSA